MQPISWCYNYSIFFTYSRNFEMLDKNEEKYENPNTSWAKGAFQLKLKAFFEFWKAFMLLK